MNAHLETTFKKGFLLSEESLIKLDDIVRKRLVAIDPAATVQFKVFRVDGMLVTFDTPAAVAAEENSTRNAIKRVELLSAGKGYKLSLQFDPKENTDLEIEADDRDFAYLLFSDVKEYLQSEVLKFRTFSFDEALSSKNTVPFLMLPFFGVAVYGMKEAPAREAVAATLKSTDVQQKLNFLIENRVASESIGPMKYYLIGMVVVMAVILFIGGVLDRVCPRNLFYWGKGARAYDRLLQVREKVMWGVVIAFVIGIASTVFVDYMKKPGATSALGISPAANRSVSADIPAAGIAHLWSAGYLRR
jgi:hypothetical protein